MNSRPALILVHHFLGSPRSVARQARLLPGWLPVEPVVLRPSLADSSSLFSPRFLKRSLWDRWTDSLEQALDSASGELGEARELWFFSQSMPGHAVLELLARRPEWARRTAGWIADGGPFLDLHQSTVNLLLREQSVRSAQLARALATVAFPVLGHRFSETAMRKRVISSWAALHAHREGRPLRVLSLRGALDPLVTPQMIDRCLDLTPWPEALLKVDLPQSHHLDGLKFDGDRYQSAVRAFLS